MLKSVKQLVQKDVKTLCRFCHARAYILSYEGLRSAIQVRANLHAVQPSILYSAVTCAVVHNEAWSYKRHPWQACDCKNNS